MCTVYSYVHSRYRNQLGDALIREVFAEMTCEELDRISKQQLTEQLLVNNTVHDIPKVKLFNIINDIKENAGYEQGSCASFICLTIFNIIVWLVPIIMFMYATLHWLDGDSYVIEQVVIYPTWCVAMIAIITYTNISRGSCFTTYRFAFYVGCVVAVVQIIIFFVINPKVHVHVVTLSTPVLTYYYYSSNTSTHFSVQVAQTLPSRCTLGIIHLKPYISPSSAPYVLDSFTYTFAKIDGETKSILPKIVYYCDYIECGRNKANIPCDGEVVITRQDVSFNNNNTTRGKVPIPSTKPISIPFILLLTPTLILVPAGAIIIIFIVKKNSSVTEN